MVSFTELRSQDIRHNVRVKDKKRIIWHLQNSDLKGQGRIHNISTSGMLLETNGLFIPHNRCVFSFTSNLGINNYVPQQGQVVWAKKRKGKANRYLCGIKFVEPAGFVLAKLHQRVQRGLKKAKALKVTEKTSNGLVFAGIIALMAFTVWLSGGIYQDIVVANHKLMGTSNQQAQLTRSYVTLYQTMRQKFETAQQQLQTAMAELTTTRQQYQQSQTVLSGVTAELEETKAVLAQTESLLVQARAGAANAADAAKLTEAQLADLEQTRAGLVDKIASLEAQNAQLTGEMNSINGKLQYYEGNVENMAEGQSILKFYRQKMKEVKSRIRGFRNEARQTRLAALRERDRIRTILGNNGFLVKNGQEVVVDQTKYQAATLGQAAAPSNVKVDVKIVD